MANKTLCVNYQKDLIKDICAPPPPRTKWTRHVPHPVLIGHATVLTKTSVRPRPATRRAPRAHPTRRRPIDAGPRG